LPESAALIGPLEEDNLRTHRLTACLTERPHYTLYVDRGDYFVDATTEFGLNASRPFTGLGTGMHDFNHDGRRDIYVANGRVARTTISTNSTRTAPRGARDNKLRGSHRAYRFLSRSPGPLT